MAKRRLRPGSILLVARESACSGPRRHSLSRLDDFFETHGPGVVRERRKVALGGRYGELALFETTEGLLVRLTSCRSSCMTTRGAV